MILALLARRLFYINSFSPALPVQRRSIRAERTANKKQSADGREPTDTDGSNCRENDS